MAVHASGLSTIRNSELPTWLVLGGNYGAWMLLTWQHALIPWWLLLFLGGYVVCVHGSLQHEFLHGHPTGNAWLNKFLVWAPMGLWMPYTIYRDSHIAHHECERLTDPAEDPESFYVTPTAWARLPAPVRRILTVNNTLAGRLIIGPAIAVAGFWFKQARLLLTGDWRYAGVWAWHFVGCAVVLYWVTVVCEMSFWRYLLLFAWPGLSLTLLRSFTEHRPAADLGQRTIIVEGSWLTRLMFLNNNYHHVHHADPGLAWSRLKHRYEQDRVKINADNGGFYFRGYSGIFKRYLFKPKDIPVDPIA